MLIFILFTIQHYYNKKYHFNYLNGNMQSLVRRYAQLGFKPGGRWILSVDGFSSLRQLPICFIVFFFSCFQRRLSVSFSSIRKGKRSG